LKKLNKSKSQFLGSFVKQAGNGEAVGAQGGAFGKKKQVNVVKAEKFQSGIKNMESELGDEKSNVLDMSMNFGFGENEMGVTGGIDTTEVAR
jgi:hypothetical protein